MFGRHDPACKCRACSGQVYNRQDKGIKPLSKKTTKVTPKNDPRGKKK